QHASGHEARPCRPCLAAVSFIQDFRALVPGRGKHMRRVALATLSVFCLSSLAISENAAAAAAQGNGVELVCLVTFANAWVAKTRNPIGVSAASAMPRVTALQLQTDYSRIYDYPDQASVAKACQCFSDPAPANNMAQRNDTLRACPKPTRIE